MLFSQSLHTILIACAVLSTDNNINRLWATWQHICRDA